MLRPIATTSLQRARRTLAKSLPDRTQQATQRALGDARMRELVDRYVAAWERRDVDALVRSWPRT